MGKLWLSYQPLPVLVGLPGSLLLHLPQPEQKITASQHLHIQRVVACTNGSAKHQPLCAWLNLHRPAFMNFKMTERLWKTEQIDENSVKSQRAKETKSCKVLNCLQHVKHAHTNAALPPLETWHIRSKGFKNPWVWCHHWISSICFPYSPYTT